MQQKGLQCVAGLLITECDKSKLQSTMVFGLQSATRWVTKCDGMTNYDGTCVSNTYGVNILLVSIWKISDIGVFLLTWERDIINF